MTWEFSGAARSVRGGERDGNQDAVCADRGLLAVADGFGPQGARMAEAAVGALGALGDGGTATALGAAVDRARDAVAPVGDSGTTLTAVLLSEAGVTVAHVGDTRAYLLRDGRLSRLTVDHSQVRVLVDAGRLTPQEAAVHPERALLVRALGHGEQGGVDLGTHSAGVGDRYLLCSDGLWTVLPDAAIERALLTSPVPQDAVAALLAAAEAAGAPDDVSCVVADVVRGT